MILTDRQIREAQAVGDILIDPFEDKQVQAVTYDFRVGHQGASTSSKKIIDLRQEGYMLLAPGDIAVVMGLEELRLGRQYAARFGLRSKYARKGPIATTGPQLDPGFHGRLIIHLTNLTPKPVPIPYKDDFVSVEFHRLEEPVIKPYSGPYQGRMELGPEEIEFITESEGMALSEVLTTLRSLSQNVGELALDVGRLTTEFRNFRWIVPIIVTVGMAVVAIIVAIK